MDKINYYGKWWKNLIQKNIEFNPGLNVIIGGKSSGKSLLLYQLLKAISL